MGHQDGFLHLLAPEILAAFFPDAQLPVFDRNVAHGPEVIQNLGSPVFPHVGDRRGGGVILGDLLAEGVVGCEVMDGECSVAANGDGFQFLRAQDCSVASPPGSPPFVVDDAGKKNLLFPGRADAGHADPFVADLPLDDSLNL